MSDLLNQASLVMVPSGYKEDTVYSVVPSDGSGDLSFTRTSNGTRINSAGLVEVCPWNLVQQSETFDNAGWVKDLGASVTANTTTAPNGTTTADTLTIASGQYMYQGVSLVTSQAYTISVYVKVASGTKQFKFNTYGSGNDFTSSAYTATTEWQRFDYTFTTIASGTTNIYPILVDGLTGGDFYIYGAQLNIGSTAKPYFPTTDRLNVPRLTYQNGGGGCPSLLLEKQSTNLVSYSEQLDNAVWLTAGGITVTANATTSPDGTQNADLFSHGSFSTYLYQNLGTLSGTITTSIFVKKGSQSSIAFGFVSGGFGGGMSVKFNLDTQTFSTPTNYANFTSISATYESYGNGWYRLNLTGTTATSTGYYFVLGSLLDSFAVDAYLWGAQVEASSYATSYIVSTSSSATRVADLGSNDVFGSTYTLDADFCLFQDFECFDFGNFPVFWSGGNYATGGDYRSYMIGYNTSNVTLFGINEVQTAQLTAFTFAPNTRYKLAVRRVGSTINWFVNGTKYSNTAGTTTTSVKIRSISGASLGGQNVMKLNEAIIFEDKTLTDEDCISLTTI